MSKLTRKEVLALIRAAAVEGNEEYATRLLIENRVSYKAFARALKQGREIRLLKLKEKEIT
jgi:hypothetical protein